MDTMAPKVLFQKSFKILFYLGLQFEYENSWKGKWAKIRLSYLIMTNLLQFVGQVYYMIHQDELEKFVETVSPASSCLFSTVKLINFYVMRAKYQELTDKLRSMASEGKIYGRSIFRSKSNNSRTSF